MLMGMVVVLIWAVVEMIVLEFVILLGKVTVKTQSSVTVVVMVPKVIGTGVVISVRVVSTTISAVAKAKTAAVKRVLENCIAINDERTIVR